MNSAQQPEALTFYLDRNLGSKLLARDLREQGIDVEIHDDHLASDAPDEHWIALCASRGWIAITKDRNIRYRSAEIEAIRFHSAKVVVIRAKNSTAKDCADIIISHFDKLSRHFKKQSAPFILGIDRYGKVTVYPV